jgi:O-antigen biosynthesis protein
MKISYLLPITQETGVRLTDTSCAMKYLGKTIESVLNQSIPNWELVIVVQGSLLSKIQDVLNEQAIKRPELLSTISKSVKVITTKSSNAAIACNAGLEEVKGKYVAVVQAGDMLALHASYELIKCVVENPKARFIYTDHDHIDLIGQRFKPFFKPDLSPDLLYCQNYINNLALINKTPLKRLGGWNTRYGSAYGYALNLNAIGNLVTLDRPNPKLLGNQSPIKHLSQILYHERVKVKVDPRKNKYIELKPSKLDEEKQSQQGLDAIRRFLKDQGRNAKVTQIKPKLYRHHWSIPKPEPLVSLIIPTRDGYDILKTCVDSILKKTTYTNYEILIVDNQSSELKAISYMDSLQKKHKNIRILKYDKPFNYSAINNYAVTKAKGEILGLINNDTEVITPNWLTEMVAHAIRQEIGCVGALLFYPDYFIQHGGINVGLHGVADSSFKYMRFKEANNYFNYLMSARNQMAVTAACMLVEKYKYIKQRGFDQRSLKIAFNDVDLCLRLFKAGYYNLWIPDAELFHHESKTRIENSNQKDQKIIERKEHRTIQRRYSTDKQFDVFSPNISQGKFSYI